MITHNTNIKPVSSFTGRETELKDLRQRMEDGLRSVLVSGMGGIGKTQICRMLFCEYVGKHKDQVNIPFEHIGYVEYDEDICSSLLKCLKYKKQSNSKNNKEAAWRELEELSANGRLLLFIDNVNKTVKEDVSLNRLCSIPGAIILTSRKAFLCDEFQSYRIGYLNTDQCREIYEKIYFEETEKRLKTEEITDLNYIIESLVAWHTLTIDILAHLSRSRGWKVFKLKVQLEKKGFALEYLEDGELINIQKSYEILYNLSGLKKSEKNILEAFSLFPYRFLSAELCNLWLLKDAKINKQCNILYELYKKGWLQYDLDQDCYAMHPVFAQFIYEKCKPYIKKHLGLIISCKNSLKVSYHAKVTEYEIYINLAESVGNKLVIGDSMEGLYFLTAIADALEYIGQFMKAVEWYKQILNISQNIYGDNEQFFIPCYERLSALYNNLGEYDLAEKITHKTIDIKLKEFGECDQDLLDSYIDLAFSYTGQEKYNKAEALLMEVLDIYETLEEEDLYWKSTVYNNLGMVYMRKGEYGKAEDLFQKSVHIRETILGGEDPLTVLVYVNLADLYYKLEQYQEAEKLFYNSLNILENTLGENHPLTIITCYRLTDLYEFKEDYTRYEAMCIKTLEAIRKRLGEKHQYTADSYYNLASVHFQKEYTKKEEYIYERNKTEELIAKSLEIRKELLGDEHSDTADSYNMLACLYFEKEEYNKAEELFVKCLELRKNILGENHPDTIGSFFNLALLFRKKKMYKSALNYFLIAYNSLITNFGTKHKEARIFCIYMKVTYLEFVPEGNFEEWFKNERKKQR